MPSFSGSTVYYCWLCQAEVPPFAPTSRHYESGREIMFCTIEHWSEYEELRKL